MGTYHYFYGHFPISYARNTNTMASHQQVWVDRVKMMDLRIGTDGGGANVGIIFYDAWSVMWETPGGGHAILGNSPKRTLVLIGFNFGILWYPKMPWTIPWNIRWFIGGFTALPERHVHPNVHHVRWLRDAFLEEQRYRSYRSPAKRAMAAMDPLIDKLLPGKKIMNYRTG